MKNKKPSKYFVRFLVSYLLVLLVPAIFIFILFSNLSFREMRKKIAGDNKLVSYMFEEDMERTLDACSDIVSNLSYYQAIAPFALSRYPSKAISLQEALKKYLVTNDIFDEIGVYFFMDSYIYTNKSSYTKESYVKYLKLQSDDRVNFLQKIQETNAPSFYQGETLDGLSVLIYVQPYYFQGEKEGTIWFCINQDRLGRLLANIPDNLRKTALFDSSGNMLAGEIPEILEKPDIIGFIYQVLEGEDITLEKDDYTIEVRKLGDHPICYIQVIPDEELFAKLKETRRQYILIMSMTMLFGGVAIILVTRRLYRPIRSLKELISWEGYGDEFSSFESAYTDLKAKNEKLHSKWMESMKIHQQYLLSCLINGSAEGQEDFMEQAEDCGLDLSADWWSVLIDRMVERNQEEVTSTLREMFPSACIYLCISLKDCTVYTVGTEERQSDKTWKPVRKMGIAVSAPVRSVSDLWAAYAEARILSEPGHLEQGEIFGLKQWNTALYDGILKEFENCLESGSWLALNMLLDSLEKKMREDHAPLEIRKLVYYQIIRLLQKNHVCQEIWESSDELVDRILMAPDYGELEKLVSREIERNLELLKKEFQKPALSLDKIIYYVDRHYLDQDFSLKMAADHFHVSVSYLSLFFKNTYGSKLIDYYTGLRMERAIELMRSTSLGIREIMMEVGYFNLSSFIRRFKQLYGITPGEYKKLYAEKK